MSKLFLFFALMIASKGFSQKIIGSAMADDNGITNKQKDAKFLIVEKQVNDSEFEKLDYFFAGPMISCATFKDRELKMLNGLYVDYNSNGILATTGQYVSNKKDGDWYIYNGTTPITKYVFHLDTLISNTKLDSLNKIKNLIKRDTTEKVEAVYKGGNARIRDVISSKFKVPQRTLALKKDGTVLVRFVVDTTGKPRDVEILKSVEFAFDQEALRVASLLTNWIPASQNGKKVNAYRIQPISINLK